MSWHGMKDRDCVRQVLWRTDVVSLSFLSVIRSFCRVYPWSVNEKEKRRVPFPTFSKIGIPFPTFSKIGIPFFKKGLPFCAFFSCQPFSTFFCLFSEKGSLFPPFFRKGQKRTKKKEKKGKKGIPFSSLLLRASRTSASMPIYTVVSPL